MSENQTTEYLKTQTVMQKLEPLFFSMGCFGTDEDADPDAFIIHKFGRSASLTNATWSTVWDHAETVPTYPLLDEEKTMYLVSTSSDEVADIKVFYLDGNFERKKVTITMTGDTNVLVATDVMRPYRMVNVSADSTIGIINLVDGDDTVYAEIVDSGEEYNQTQMAVYTVPLGYTAVVFSINAGVGSGKEVEIHYKAQPNGEANKTKIPLMLYQANYQEAFSIPFKFPEKTFLNVTAKAGGTGITATARFSMYLIKTPLFEELCRQISI